MEIQAFFEIPKDNLKRRFCTSELAEILNIPVYRVRDAYNNCHINGSIEKTANGRKCFFSYTDAKIMIEWLKKRQIINARKKTNPINHRTPTNVEAIKAMHPLVTDDRCFVLEWWPDTIPVCFKDMEF